MIDSIEKMVARDTGLPLRGVDAVITLTASGATVPFIARYRKEATGELDEEQIRLILDRAEKIEALDKRREAILSSLEERELLTPELKSAVEAAQSMSILEDLYLPYRPKRRTRASAAREQGLEPLALMLNSGSCTDPAKAAEAFIDPEKGVEHAEAALAGARDILAEQYAESAPVRAEVRGVFKKKAFLSSGLVKKAAEEDPAGAARFSDYFDWKEPASRAAGHRLLAIRRGAALGFLRWHLLPPEKEGMERMKRLCLPRGSFSQAELAAEDGYRRLLAPALENELKAELLGAAESEAIGRFGGNLKELLLQPPFGSRPVLAVDPGLRTGCKLAVIAAGGELLDHDVIYPLPPHRKTDEAAAKVLSLLERYNLEAIAVGNGTGGREMIDFFSTVKLPEKTAVVSVDESGASVYSASPLAREEFPDQDVTVRGAVSIGRRLQDALSELVKIDAKAIGVGQYQHDVDQKALQKALDETVESCVNSVGVELNNASGKLLSYVSGISANNAKKIVAVRADKGAFKSRRELLAVPGVGPKVFEQAAGFLRIRGAENPLDASSVHPERYPLVERMAADAGVPVGDLVGPDREARKNIRLERYIDEETGMATLRDILSELERPGRDPRRSFEIFRFSDDVHTIDDLKEGMVLPGIVTNITAFGAFVDVGVHQDGLVHISKLADRFVKDPAEVVHLKQQVMVRVESVDTARRRIALSMRSE
jgi:uncharacterized protein